MGWPEEILDLAQRERGRHAIFFYAVAAVALLILLEGVIAITSIILPPWFCIGGMAGNCAGVQIAQSNEYWSAAVPLSLENVRLGKLGGNATIRNNGDVPVKIVSVRMQQVEDKGVSFGFAEPVLIQPGGEFEAALTTEKGCDAGVRRFDVSISYAAPGIGTATETGKRLLVECAG